MKKLVFGGFLVVFGLKTRNKSVREFFSGKNDVIFVKNAINLKFSGIFVISNFLLCLM